MENTIKNLSDITILIPLRIDNEERRENLNASLSYLAGYPSLRVIVLEADTTPQYNPTVFYSNLTYRFVEDHDPIFYRTRYLNILLREVQTPVAGIWDSDVIVPVNQISEAIRQCMGGITLCYPFDGRFYAVSADLSHLYKKSGNMDLLRRNESLHWLMHGLYSVGGAFVVHVEKYRSAGGENEHFYGWGPEDTERRERIYNLGLSVGRITGCLYHLHHPRGINSRFASNERELCNRREYLNICRMRKNELEAFIAIWPWIKE